MLFNPQNPTGHYKLSLENSTDFAVAQQLLLLDRWECVVNRRNRRVDVAQSAPRCLELFEISLKMPGNALVGLCRMCYDVFMFICWILPGMIPTISQVSQRGNQSQLRNECHQGRSLHLSVPQLKQGNWNFGKRFRFVWLSDIRYIQRNWMPNPHGDIMCVQYEANIVTGIPLHFGTSQAQLTQLFTMQRYAEFPGHCPPIGLKSDGAGAPSHTSLVTLPPTLSRWIWKTIDIRGLNGSHGYIIYIFIYLLNPLYPIFPPEKHSAGVARGHRGAGGEHAEWVGHSRIWRVWMRLRDQLPGWESDGDLWRLLTCVEVITPRRAPSHWVMRFGRRRCLVIGISFPVYS